MNYFVTVGGIEVISNLTKKQAINYGNKEYKKHPENGTLNIGIGKVKIKKGKFVYTCLPLHFYDNLV